MNNKGREIAEIKTEMMKILAKVCYNLECKYRVNIEPKSNKDEENI